jgi:hypothetical protein
MLYKNKIKLIDIDYYIDVIFIFREIYYFFIKKNIYSTAPLLLIVFIKMYENVICVCKKVRFLKSRWV